MVIFSKSKDELLNTLNDTDKNILIDMVYFYMDKFGVEKSLIIVSNILKNIDYKIALGDLESIIEIPEIDEYISRLKRDEINNTLIIDLYTLYKHNNDNTIFNERALTLQSIVARYRLLSKEETKKLFLEYKLNGSKEAKEKLINHNLRLVLNVAKYRSYKCKTSIEDLFQTGCEYLIRAIDLFDIDKEYSFSTYAYVALRRGMNKYARMDSTIKVGQSGSEKADLIRKVEDEFFAKFKKKPMINEIASATNLSVNNIKLIKRGVSHVTSLTESISESDTLLIDMVKDEHDYIGEVENKIADEMIFEKISRVLDDRELIIVIYNLGLFRSKMTLEELALIFNVSSEAIRLIREKALRKIKDCLYSSNPYYHLRDVKNEFTIAFLLDKCNFDVLSRAIGLLGSEYQNLLTKRYSNDLMHIRAKSFLTREEFMTIYQKIVPLLNEKIKELNYEEQGNIKENAEFLDLFRLYDSEKVYEALNNCMTPEEIALNNIDSEKLGKIKKYLQTHDTRTLQDFFPDYNPKVLRMIIEGPTPIYKYLIIKRYGHDYLNNPIKENNLIESDNTKFLNAVVKMGEILRNKLNIYLFFNEYSEYEVDSFLAELNLSQQAILKPIFGNNYKQLRGVDLDTFAEALKVIDDIKKYYNKNRVKVYISLESLYPRASKELLYEVVNNLKEKDKKILIYYFGESLNKCIDTEAPNLQVILNNINNLVLEKIGIMTIFDYTECADKSMIEYAINNVYAEDRFLIEKYLGKNFFTEFKNNVIDFFTYNRFLKVIKELKYCIRLRRGKNPPKLNIQDMYKTSLSFRLGFNALNTYLEYKNALYLSLFLGYYKNHKYTIQEIGDLFKKDENEVADIINSSLEVIKNKNINLDELVLVKQK